MEIAGNIDSSAGGDSAHLNQYVWRKRMSLLLRTFELRVASSLPP
jgi:hypothetical protein